MSITNYRLVADCTVVMGWEYVAKGTAAVSGVQIEHASLRIAPGIMHFVPDGSHGTKFPHKHGIRNLYTEPTAVLECLASVQTTSVLLESVMRGTPTASQAGGTIGITNDGGSYVNALVLNGIRPLSEAGNIHVSSVSVWYIYINVTDGGGGTGHTISIYKDAARTQLVAQGTGDDSAAVTLAEQNNSGLSGTMTLGTVSGNDIDIIGDISQITYQFATLPTEYFSLFFDTGGEVYRLVDCVVKRLSITAAGKDAVYLNAEIMAMGYDPDSALPATVATMDYAYYITADSVVTLEKVGTGTYTVEPLSYSLIFDGENLRAPEVNAATPTAFIEEMAPVVNLELTANYSDEMDEIQGQQETPNISEDITIALTYGSNVLSFALKSMEWKEADPIELTHGGPTRDTVGEFADFAAVGQAKEDITGTEEPCAVTLAS